MKVAWAALGALGGVGLWVFVMAGTLVCRVPYLGRLWCGPLPGQIPTEIGLLDLLTLPLFVGVGAWAGWKIDE